MRLCVDVRLWMLGYGCDIVEKMWEEGENEGSEKRRRRGKMKGN